MRESGDGPTVYINEDLTRRRAALAKETRQLKRSRQINDCWTFNGKVVLKTVDSVVKEIRSDVSQRQTGFLLQRCLQLGIEPAMVIDNLQHQYGDINHLLFNFLIHKSVLALSAETVL